MYYIVNTITGAYISIFVTDIKFVIRAFISPYEARAFMLEKHLNPDVYKVGYFRNVGRKRVFKKLEEMEDICKW